jgi:hypothetical protein
MEKPRPAEAGASEFNADARSSQYVFRAGSALPDDKVVRLQSRLCVIRYIDAVHGPELYGIEPDKLTGAFGNLRLPGTWTTGTVDVTDKLRVRFVGPKGAVPELVRSIGRYNIVLFDGVYYGIPQGLGAVKWGDEEVASLAGVVTSRTFGGASDLVERQQGIERKRRASKSTGSRPPQETVAGAPPPADAKGVPVLVGALDGYNVVKYEGWFYGLPQALGPIDLHETDVIEMPGVVRDLSREVVEGEIREAARLQQVGG